MKKIIIILFFSSIVYGCSFDNKSRIWTGSEVIAKKNSYNNDNLEPIFKKTKDQLIVKSQVTNKNLILLESNNYKNWQQRYLNNKNNIGNLQYANNGNYEKLSKISKHPINENYLIDGDNLIFSDVKGNITVYSLSKNKLLFTYNFYKKKLRKNNKNIKLIIKNNIIIAADNLGYLYALDYRNKKLKWAKNFLVPFRSNIKIIDNILFIADEKNKILQIDFNNGEKLDELYTQPAKIVSSFESNLAFDDNKDLFFLSTTGNLYALNLINNKIIKWVINLNTENDVSFNSKPIIIQNDKILITTKNNIYLYTNKGARLWEKNIESNTKPLISGNVIFLVNKDNYLILIDVITGKILFSDKVSSIISQTFDEKFNKKIKYIKNIFLFNEKLLLISDNAYFLELKLDKNMTINSIMKKPYDIGSDILIVNKKMIIISKKKRIYNNY